MSGWDNIGSSSNESSEKKKVNFKALTKGLHMFRILTDSPRSRWVHWVQRANGGKGMSIACIGKDCPACAENKAAKANKLPVVHSNSKKHAINIIDRSDNQVYVIDKGNTLFDSLVGALMGMRAAMKNDSIQITDFDIQLNVSGLSDKPSYNSMPMPVIPLTAEDKAREVFDLDELVKPLELDVINKLMQGLTFKEIFGDSESTVPLSDADDSEFVDVKF